MNYLQSPTFVAMTQSTDGTVHWPFNITTCSPNDLWYTRYYNLIPKADVFQMLYGYCELCIQVWCNKRNIWSPNEWTTHLLPCNSITVPFRGVVHYSCLAHINHVIAYLMYSNCCQLVANLANVHLKLVSCHCR